MSTLLEVKIASIFQLFRVKPQAACLNDNSEDPDPNDPFFYRSTKQMAEVWKSRGNRAETPLLHHIAHFTRHARRLFIHTIIFIPSNYSFLSITTGYRLSASSAPSTWSSLSSPNV